mmetsp:Transcript_1179/g.3265  ORF Transcript_1179/g.3265 Transcript_1179/m.3265 type:complete len:195 (-) Transcript_1179:360-944(-)
MSGVEGGGAKPLLKAVFFDMDDTLVLTSDCDELAFVEVSAQASQLSPGVDTGALVAAFKRGMKATPWDKAHEVQVDEWRAGLWNAGLEEQQRGSMEVARQLQQTYREVRLKHFKWVDGAEDMVRRLRDQAGLAVVIITNGHHEVQVSHSPQPRPLPHFRPRNAIDGLKQPAKRSQTPPSTDSLFPLPLSLFLSL